MKCGDKEWQHCRVEKMGCTGCYYNKTKINTEEIEKARNNILRGNDIESACMIMEAFIWNGLVQVGGRVNITKIAMRQILNFVEYTKNKGILEYVKENVKLKTELKKLQKENRKLKVGINNGLDKDKKSCFYEDGHTGKCLGYSFFNDDEPCIYCQTCDAINIKED